MDYMGKRGDEPMVTMTGRRRRAKQEPGECYRALVDAGEKEAIKLEK